MREPYCVGLTGGIGCGKSSAARIFEKLGAAVVDTDEISHALTRPGGIAIPAIEREFGAEYITVDGALSRVDMRERVFRDPAAKARLEGILHPLIRDEAQARIAAARQPYVILVVPLLLETGAYREIVKRILLIDCDEDEQIARTTRRSGLKAAEVRAIMAAQLPRAKRLAGADDVLHNDSDLDRLRRDIEVLHAKYLTLAAEHARAASASAGKSQKRQ